MKYSGRSLKVFVSLFCTLMIGQLADKPLQAAETVVVRYGAFAESISIAELENVAKTGDFPESFKSYTNKLSEESTQIDCGSLENKSSD